MDQWPLTKSRFKLSIVRSFPFFRVSRLWPRHTLAHGHDWLHIERGRYPDKALRSHLHNEKGPLGLLAAREADNDGEEPFFCKFRLSISASKLSCLPIRDALNRECELDTVASVMPGMSQSRLCDRSDRLAARG